VGAPAASNFAAGRALERPMLERLLHVAATAITAVLLACSVAAAAPAPSRAPLPIGSEGQRSSVDATFGPVLAGDAVVFGTRAGAGHPARLLAAPSVGGPVRELQGPWQRLAGGSAGILARSEIVTGGGTNRYDPSYTASQTLLVGPVDGPAPTLSTCIAPSAADGARVAYQSGEHCEQLVVRDVVAGREIVRLPLTTVVGLHPDAGVLRLAGDWVSWERSDPDRRRHVMVADTRTGTVRDEPAPVEPSTYALAPDGTLAFLRGTGFRHDWRYRLVLRPPGGVDREIANWSAWDASVTLVAFSGDALVVRVRQQARASERRPAADVLLALAPDGSARELLRALPAADGSRTSPTPELLGADVEDGRLAWMLRDCDEVAVGSSAIADLPVGGIDLTRPERCARPVLERTLLRLDRRGRTTVAVRCPAACSGTLTLTGVEPSDTYRRLARRSFSLSAGRHRIAVRVSSKDRAWIAHRRGRALAAKLALTGSTGTRPSSRFASVRVVAQRGT
jgi:hypothetical protein